MQNVRSRHNTPTWFVKEFPKKIDEKELENEVKTLEVTTYHNEYLKFSIGLEKISESEKNIA